MWKTLWRKTPHLRFRFSTRFCRIKIAAFAAHRQAKRTFPQFPPPLLRLLLKKYYIHFWIVSAEMGKRKRRNEPPKTPVPTGMQKMCTHRRGDHRSPAFVRNLPLPPLCKGRCRRSRRRDCYRAKKIERAWNNPSGAHAPAPLSQGSQNTHTLGRGRRPERPARTNHNGRPMVAPTGYIAYHTNIHFNNSILT